MEQERLTGSSSLSNMTRTTMKAKSRAPAVEAVEMGSGNVFADLGLPDQTTGACVCSWRRG